MALEIITIELVLPVVERIGNSNFVRSLNPWLYPGNHRLYIDGRKIAWSGNNNFSSKPSLAIIYSGRST